MQRLPFLNSEVVSCVFGIDVGVDECEQEVGGNGGKCVQINQSPLPLGQML